MAVPNWFFVVCGSDKEDIVASEKKNKNKTMKRSFIDHHNYMNSTCTNDRDKQHRAYTTIRRAIKFTVHSTETNLMTFF